MQAVARSLVVYDLLLEGKFFSFCQSQKYIVSFEKKKNYKISLCNY